jgi:hypothetical protein
MTQPDVVREGSIWAVTIPQGRVIVATKAEADALSAYLRNQLCPQDANPSQPH